MPNPVAAIKILSGEVPDYKSDGKLSKNDLLAAGGIIVMMRNFDFDVNFEEVRFTTSAVVGGIVKEYTSNSNKFTDQQKELIKQLKKGERIYFEDIVCKGPDGKLRNLSAMAFTISGE